MSRYFHPSIDDAALARLICHWRIAVGLGVVPDRTPTWRFADRCRLTLDVIREWRRS